MKEKINEFSNLVLKQLDKCKQSQCCASRSSQSGEPCCLDCKGKCQCKDCAFYRELLPILAKYFVLQLLCWPEEMKDLSKHEVMKWRFNRKCWTGKCPKPKCLKFSTFMDKFQASFLLIRNSGSGSTSSWNVMLQRERNLGSTTDLTNQRSSAAPST